VPPAENEVPSHDSDSLNQFEVESAQSLQLPLQPFPPPRSRPIKSINAMLPSDMPLICPNRCAKNARRECCCSFMLSAPLSLLLNNP
jgi:hypothetical protein